MSYTTLRVVEAGIVLYAQHAARFSSPAARAAFQSFARDVEPGVWSVRFVNGVLSSERRSTSRLADGQPVRFVVSPFAATSGAFAKPMPPSPYDAVRVPGVATLLTSSDGAEIYESCVAAVVAWDGARVVSVPGARPRVASSAEECVRTALGAREAPVRVADDLPLLLVNAVRTGCPFVPGREDFPLHVRAAVEDAIEATARRG